MLEEFDDRTRIHPKPAALINAVSINHVRRETVCIRSKDLGRSYRGEDKQMITSINHITLSVRSLNESFEFYKDVLGFRPLMKRQKSAYFLAGDLWFCIEEDQAIRTSELPEYTHIAFSVAQTNFHAISARITDSGARLFKANKSEGDSIYFLDPNGHKLEVHVGDWKSRLAAYRNDPHTEFFY